jgi:hypothetical protein
MKGRTTRTYVLPKGKSGNVNVASAHCCGDLWGNEPVEQCRKWGKVGR